MLIFRQKVSYFELGIEIQMASILFGSTVWEIRDFSIAQILREVNFDVLKLPF